jgi:hypothetical protein
MIRVDTYNDYKIILLKLIKNKSLKMLEDVINDDKNIEYREMLKSDDIVKNKWVNDIFKMDDKDLCDIILNLFEIDEEIPETDSLGDIIYISDLRYRSNLVNKKKNIYYMFDLCNLEFDNNISMEDFYYSCEDQVYFSRIKLVIESRLYRNLNRTEEEYILDKSYRYHYYINNEYKNLVEDILEMEGCMDSNIECYNILYNYLGKRPNKFEVKLLMKMSV